MGDDKFVVEGVVLAEGVVSGEGADKVGIDEVGDDGDFVGGDAFGEEVALEGGGDDGDVGGLLVHELFDVFQDGDSVAVV